MSNDYYGINVTDDPDEVRQYAITELEEFGKIAPCLTLYRFNMKMLTLYFPREATPDERQFQFLKAAFMPNLLNCSAARLIVDSTVMKSAFMKNITPDNDGYIDTMLSCYFSSVGIKCKAFPYLMHPENKYPIWEDLDKLDLDKDFLDSQEQIISFASLAFLMSNNTLPWDSYIKYLDQQGFRISYHHPYTDTTIGTILHTTMV